MGNRIGCPGHFAADESKAGIAPKDIVLGLFAGQNCSLTRGGQTILLSYKRDKNTIHRLDESMFLHNSGKRTGRSCKAPGARCCAQIKLSVESLESRRLLTGNDPWEADWSFGDNPSSFSSNVEFSYDNHFESHSTGFGQQDVADSVANGILARLEALLSNQNPVPPELSPVLPSELTWAGTVTNPLIDSFEIGRGVTAADATDCAIDVEGSDDPLVAIGFGEAVDDVTLAVNHYCSQQVLDLANSLELLPGQIVASIWFDPINFSVSIGGNEVSYDYDNNPSAIVGYIPGASLVVTSAGQFTPGGVQSIMFAGDASSIDIQMSTTNSGELMRGGVNIYTVTAGSNGLMLQPTISTAFQGYLPRDTIAMSFDPSQPSFASSGMSGAMVQAFMDSHGSSAASQVSTGGGGIMPLSIGGDFAAPDFFAIASLDPAGLTHSGVDISGGIGETDQEGEVDALGNQIDQLGEDDFDVWNDEEEEVPAEEEDNLEADEFDGEGDALPGEEEELEEAISVLFNIIGESLASDSGHVDVIEILETDSGSSDQSHMHDAPALHQVWETSEFSTRSIDEAEATAMVRMEPMTQGKVVPV